MTDTPDTIDVLHVDDDPDFTELTATFLERVDDRIEVRAASGAAAGLDALADYDVDCIVSDYDMPATDGIEFLEAVREDHPELPFILYTGKGSEEVASDAISAGVTDYLQKGTGSEQYELLANRIRNAVEAHESHRLLTERTRRLETLIDNLPGMVYRCRNAPAWPMETVEGEVESLTGHAADDLERNEVQWGEDVVHPDDRDPVWETVQDALADDGTFETTYRIVTDDGTIRWVWERGRGVYEGDSLVALEGFITDVTERKEREERLERTTARLEALFENSPDMIDVHTDEGTILDVNKRFCEVFDQPREELLGTKVWDLDLESDPEELRDVWDGMDVGERHEVETTFERADGERFPVKVHLTRLPTDDEEERFIVISRDVSERKARERTLRRYEQMVNTMREAACIYDEEGRFDLVNERMAELYGTTPDALEGRESTLIAAIRDDADGDPYRELLDGDREELRGEIEQPIGEYGRAVLEYRLTPLVSEGSVEGVVGVTRDITDQRTREREFERTRELLERTERIADVGGWELDPDTMEVFWTAQLYELFGVDRDTEVSLETALDAYHEADRRIVADAVETALESGDPFDVEARCRGPTDEARWLRVQGVPTVENGDVVTLRGAVQDVTEQRERERQLQRAQRDASELFNGMNDSAWVIGLDERFRAVNDAAVETLGYSRSELLSMRPHDIDVGLEDGEITALIEAMPEDEMQVFETAHETADGERIPVEINSSLITYQGEPAVLSIARDISDRKQREQQLAEFASVVSHDLRNPLNVAEGRIQLAREECDSEHLEAVERMHERMNSLINDLLTLARSGTSVIEPETVELGRFLDTCWRNVATADATLRSRIDRPISGDRSRLQQLFENLFRNAVEHAGEDVTVTVGELDDGFYVEDDGPGIPPERRSEAFEMGYSTADGGTGFGLNIVERVVEEHGWEISLTEGSEGGARFEIRGVGFER
ncbi:PAS domain S-box protein [Halobellus limi]|uniref:histidine kinase n=1 Tax=Halobellus limi TaxID=699433 RepID=A0A1H6CKA2_9EURY|nr:PAS domain S-box protein [Halobellus limi]SEG73358.1 PAS domain S-box-containing protein [Halobellus limi]